MKNRYWGHKLWLVFQTGPHMPARVVTAFSDRGSAETYARIKTDSEMGVDAWAECWVPAKKARKGKRSPRRQKPVEPVRDEYLEGIMEKVGRKGAKR